ncbi:MAG: gamma-glutamyl-gamma-aminobutyrate hydrolase family protein [Ilumatobacteraceae bacterium]|nr:gamma-glutamyl-gamma-aminobutyrate hydrolase family protein [Ilumatobacteraceae bacterium]
MTTPCIALLVRSSQTAKTFSTAVVTRGQLYIDSVHRAGGMPLLMPPTYDPDVIDATLRRCDGVLVMGGGDVDPSLYAEERHAKCYDVNISHDRFEIAVLLAAIALDKPVLAICRGAQVLNVALGGTLIQHLDNAQDHGGLLHEVDVVPNTRLAAALSSTTSNGMSWHHQAIKSVAPDLLCVGQALDGTVEAVEHRTATWVLGVQWHPEKTAHEDPVQQSLFDALVNQAI